MLLFFCDASPGHLRPECYFLIKWGFLCQSAAVQNYGESRQVFWADKACKIMLWCEEDLLSFQVISLCQYVRL